MKYYEASATVSASPDAIGLMWRQMPDLQPSFDKFVHGLKQRAEA